MLSLSDIIEVFAGSPLGVFVDPKTGFHAVKRGKEYVAGNDAVRTSGRYRLQHITWSRLPKQLLLTQFE